MHRIGLSKPFSRCRNLRSVIDGGRAGAVSAQSGSDQAMQICEVSFESEVSEALRDNVLSQTDLFCGMCGAAPGDIDDLTGRKVRLHIGHIVDENIGGKDELSNLRTLCSTCNQGAKNITSVKPPAIWLLSQIRRQDRRNSSRSCSGSLPNSKSEGIWIAARTCELSGARTRSPRWKFAALYMHWAIAFACIGLTCRESRTLRSPLDAK